MYNISGCLEMAEASGLWTTVFLETYEIKVACFKYVERIIYSLHVYVN